MRAYLIGGVTALLLAAAGVFMWSARSSQTSPIAPAPAAAATADAAPLGVVDLAPPPAASEKTREEKRFSRYDKDKNGAVARGEYLAGRQKGFAKLDLDHDGKLSFDEYAAKGVAKFAAADRDKNGALNAAEFATTRVVRKTKSRARCAPTLQAPAPTDAPSEDS